MLKLINSLPQLQMTYLSKSVIENFSKLLKAGWEPTRSEIKEKYFKNDKMDITRKDMLINSLITRTRRKLKKEGLFFYYLQDSRKYIILEKVGDRLEIDRRLWAMTKSFANSTHQLLVDTIQAYPELTMPLLEYKARFSIMQELMSNMSNQLHDGIDQITGKEHGN